MSAADPGEQGLTEQEKELVALRNRVRELEADCTRRAQSEAALRDELGVVERALRSVLTARGP